MAQPLLLRLIRLVHILSSAIIASTIVLAVALGTDIADQDFYKSKKFRSLYHYSGVAMIFSGVILIVLTKSHLENEHSGSQSKDLKEWIAHYPYKFMMGMTLTPLFDRLIRFVVLGPSQTSST